MSVPTVLVIANTSWYLYNFRLNLMKELAAAGFHTVAVAPPDPYSQRLIDAGFPFRSYLLHRRSLNPFRELVSLVHLAVILREVKPDVILSYTPKVNIYASLAAALCGVPIINNVAGLGYAFTSEGTLARIATILYRFAFRHSAKVFFQNEEDLRLFVENGTVSPAVAERLPGSGVDTRCFTPETQPEKENRFIFLLVARLLWDKGIAEYLAALQSIRQEYPQTRFQLLGPIDTGNPAAITEAQVRQWEAAGMIDYLGATDSVKEYLARADCVVLPSFYREGVPRSLLEAASMAKPIITTDAPGCRDTVDNGVTGYLCRQRDPEDLAEKMRRVLRLPEVERREMGARGRVKMIRDFDERIVLGKYLGAIQEIVACNQ